MLPYIENILKRVLLKNPRLTTTQGWSVLCRGRPKERSRIKSTSAPKHYKPYEKSMNYNQHKRLKYM